MFAITERMKQLLNNFFNNPVGVFPHLLYHIIKLKYKKIFCAKT